MFVLVFVLFACVCVWVSLVGCVVLLDFCLIY